MNDKYVWALAAFFVGVMIAKDQKPSAKEQTAHNEISTAGDWWSFAGMWQAG